MVHCARGEVEPLQAGLHLLQQPLRRLRPRQRQRVPPPSRPSRTRLEENTTRRGTLTEQHGRIPKVEPRNRPQLGFDNRHLSNSYRNSLKSTPSSDLRTDYVHPPNSREGNVIKSPGPENPARGDITP